MFVAWEGGRVSDADEGGKSESFPSGIKRHLDTSKHPSLSCRENLLKPDGLHRRAPLKVNDALRADFRF